VAVAAGDVASFDLAEKLAIWVLDDPALGRARRVLDLVRERSPFALVRAVELAESVIGVGHEPESASKERRGS